MTSSNGNIFRVTGPLCGEITGPRWIPRTKASDTELWCFFDLCLNKWLNKQSWGWWFETPSRQLWRHCNVNNDIELRQQLAQVMASCLKAPNHCLNKCWYIIKSILWYSYKTNFTKSAHELKPETCIRKLNHFRNNVSISLAKVLKFKITLFSDIFCFHYQLD